MVRGIRAARPEMVFVASYPADSTAIVRSVREIGVGDSVEIFGGGMVGLQYTSVMDEPRQRAQRHPQTTTPMSRA